MLTCIHMTDGIILLFSVKAKPMVIWGIKIGGQSGGLDREWISL
ncbi:hypothetical protein HMPREF3212_00565 [Citrobacter freundii]|jgi:hypothetical protein|nr:hypothetical protein HMPREF3212_00565 [Citrobacter freundii]